MESFQNVADFLGEERLSKFKDGVVTLLLDHINLDLNSLDVYMFDAEAMMQRVAEEVYETALRRAKEKFLDTIEATIMEQIERKVCLS